MFDNNAISKRDLCIFFVSILIIVSLVICLVSWQNKILTDKIVAHNIKLYNLKINVDQNKINTEVYSMLNLSKDQNILTNINIEFDFIRDGLNNVIYSVPYFIDFIIDSTMKYGISNSVLSRKKLFKIYLDSDIHNTKYDEKFINKLLNSMDKIKTKTIIKEIMA